TPIVVIQKLVTECKADTTVATPTGCKSDTTAWCKDDTTAPGAKVIPETNVNSSGTSEEWSRTKKPTNQEQVGRSNPKSRLVAAIEQRLKMKRSKMSDEQIADSLAAISKEANLQLADLIAALATFANLEQYAIGAILASPQMRSDLIFRAVEA